MVNSVKTKHEILEEFREQWRQEVHARGKDPSIDQKRYETLESIQAFKFIQTGAAIRIQRAFRRWPKRNKEKWKKKYKKMIIKYQAQKRLYQAIQKSKTIKFNQQDLENPVKVKNAGALIITRLVKGFLGRRRFHRIHKQITEERAKKTFAVTKLQAFARKIIVWQRYPTLGYRYRLFRKKQLLFSQQSPDSFFELIPVMKTNLRTITRSSSIGILASSSKDENEVIQLGPVKYPDSFQPHQRRPTNLFPKLKISSNIDLLAEKVLIIQCAYRIFKAKKVYEKRLEAKKQQCLILLQRWTRRCLTRFKFLRFLSFAKPIWHENAQAKARRIEAAIKIQSIIRSFIRYRLYQRYVHKRDYARRAIQRWCYYRVCVHKIRFKVQLHRYYHELRLAGDLLYRQTELRWLCYYTWEGIKKTRNIEKVNHELQKIFTSHSLATGMDVAKTIKIMKDCKTLFQGSNNDFTLNSIELQYMKVKSTNEKRIDYNTFLELLCNLMILKEFRIDPPKNIWDMNDDEVIYMMKRDSNNNTTSKTTTKIPGGINTSSSPDTVSIKQLRQFRFGDNFTGRTAFILKFVIIYLSTTSDYIKVVEYLGNKSASGQVQMLLTSNIRIIQQFVRNRSTIKQLNQSLKHYQTQKKLLKQLHAIKRIQAIVKRFLSKRMVMKIAQQIYHKFIDGESEREYWFNPRNNTSFWKKPLLLGTLDCGIAIRMPTELEKYVVNCNICENNYSTCYCKDCQYCYCTSCYTTSHRAGNRNKHSYLHIDNCIQCDFQIGTKYCYTCKDLYCDSCFYYMHKKGRLRFHSYQKYTDLCDQCLRYSAQVEESSYNKQGIQIKQYYCNICYNKEYSILPKDRIKELKHNSSTGTYNNPKKRYYQCKIHLIQYYGRQVREYHEKRLEEKKKLEIQQMYEKRLNELAEIKRLTSIQSIQRIYRGYKKRQEIKDFIQQRKEFLKLREEENQYRNAWTTKLLGWMGFPQIFESDTPLEKVHKLYPWYMHHIVAECIENQWNDACQMLIEHDEYLIGKPKATLLQYLSARMNVYFNQKKYQKVCDIYNAKVLLVNTAKENYYNAEASGAFAEGKLKKMKQAVNALQKELNLIEKEQNEAYTQLAEAETALMDCVGPRRLQTLVETRRANGIPLPFKVSIRKHSRYALVEYIDQGNSSHGDLPLDEELGVTSPHSDSRGGDMSVLTHQPGEWKKKLKTGDTVVLQGIHYQIIPSMSEKKKSSKKNKSGDNSGLDNSESGTVASSKKKKTGTSVKKDDSNSHKDDSQKGKDYSESGKNDGNTTTNNNTASNDNNPLRKFDEPIEGQELRETPTANHIVLDHPWMLDDVYGIDIHKMPSTVFYYKPIKFLQRYLIRTYLTQKIIAILAIYNHKLSLLFQYLITFFDEESSSSYLFCQAMITRSIRSRNYYLSLSIYIIVLSFDFTLRRKIGRQFYRIYQLFMMIARNIYNIYATLTSNLSETPYEYWQRSLEKENIQAVYEVNGNESIVLGEFRMDIKAPVEIMREYINRRYRNVLNQSVGASYIFMRINEETGREEYCLRDDEFSIYSKDFVIMKTDPKTFESLLTVTIVKDKDRGKIFIPEYKDDFDDIGSLEKHKDDANADDQDNGSLV